MNIHFKTGSEEITPKTLERVEQKLRKLGKLLHDGDQEALVSVGFTRESGSQSSDSLWRASIQLTCPGKADVYATETGATAEIAGDRAVNELKDELRRQQGKKHSMFKRGSQFLKRLRRGW